MYLKRYKTMKKQSFKRYILDIALFLVLLCAIFYAYRQIKNLKYWAAIGKRSVDVPVFIKKNPEIKI